MRLQELTLSAPGRIDRETRTIHDVKVIGLTSKNGRKYRESALQAAIPKYEGADVNLDHVPEGHQQPVTALGGTLRNVRLKAGEGLFADLRYNTTPAGQTILGLAEDHPERFGMSHDAEGATEQNGGVTEVTEILEVHSVDAVRKPATTRSLHEQETPMKKTTFKALVEAAGYKHADRLIEMMPDELAPEAELEAPAADADPIEAVAAPLVAKVADAIKDPNTTDDEAAELAKTASETVAMVRDKIDPADKPADEPPSDPTPTQESESPEVEKLRREVATLQARTLLAESNREVTDIRVKALASADAADRKALLESWPQQTTAGPKRPESSPPRFLQEQDGGDGEYAKFTERAEAIAESSRRNS